MEILNIYNIYMNILCIYNIWGFPCLVVKNPCDSAGDIRDAGSIPGPGRSPEGETGYPLQYSCLENTMDGGAWWAIVQGVAKSRTRLKWLRAHAHVPGMMQVKPWAQGGDWDTGGYSVLSACWGRWRQLQLVSGEAGAPGPHHASWPLPLIPPGNRAASNDRL